MSPDRAALTLGMLLLVALIYLLMLKGWRSRQRRQGDLPPPPPAPVVRGDTLVPATPGVFVGTTFVDDWLDRVAVHGLAHRAAGELLVATDGVHVEREGLPDLFLPYSAISAAGTGDALAGKMVGTDGLLLVDWRLGGRLLTSGFRADEHDRHAVLADAIRSQLRPTEVTQ
ncbi:MAG: transporter [Mycobacteriales bacterium]